MLRRTSGPKEVIISGRCRILIMRYYVICSSNIIRHFTVRLSVKFHMTAPTIFSYRIKIEK